MVTADDIEWRVVLPAWKDIEQHVLPVVGLSVYHEELKPTFRQTVTAYVNVDDKCSQKQGNTESPIGSTSTGGKLFKVRLGVPGLGKSGGLRVLMSLHCDDKRCNILLVRWRRDADAGDADVAATRDE